MNPVFVKSYPAPKYNRREILRYAGVKGEVPETDKLLDECIEELKGLACKVCFAEYPVTVSGNNVDLTFATAVSEDLSKNLRGCASAVVFAATVGIGIDRLIGRYNSVSPAKALMFQAIGAERIESLCDLFNEEIKEEYKYVKSRFSPGYGDLSIELQRDIFKALDCPKKIGVTLNQSLIMSPSKSVTAIIGIASEDCVGQKGCEACRKADCEYRA